MMNTNGIVVNQYFYGITKEFTDEFEACSKIIKDNDKVPSFYEIREQAVLKAIEIIKNNK